MSIFSFLKKNSKKENRDAEVDANSEAGHVMDLGIEQSVRKKQEEQKNTQSELVLEDYTPNIPVEEVVHLEQPVHIERNREDCLQVLEENCQQIVDMKKLSENAKIEYQAVTEYLTDIQKVERMPEGERRGLNDAANKILQLTKEKEQYQKQENSVSNPCFRILQKYEGSLMEELKNMREKEEYRTVVQNDMRQLEAEKVALRYEYDNLPAKQIELKRIALAMSAIVCSLFVLFFVLQEAMEQNMTVPFIMTVVMAAGVAAYVFWEAYHNRYERAALEQKLNRAIHLLNKVKIKYINNTSSLDYSYSKYNVSSSMELEYLIKEYRKAKEAERTMEGNADRLKHYRDKLLDILELYEIKDREIWLHQLSVLIHEEEFAEMKQSLERRREGLVEKMDGYAKTRDVCFEHMHQILEEFPDLKEALLTLMKQYEITL